VKLVEHQDLLEHLELPALPVYLVRPVLQAFKVQQASVEHLVLVPLEQLVLLGPQAPAKGLLVPPVTLARQDQQVLLVPQASEEQVVLLVQTVLPVILVLQVFKVRLVEHLVRKALMVPQALKAKLVEHLVLLVLLVFLVRLVQQVSPARLVRQARQDRRAYRVHLEYKENRVLLAFKVLLVILV
jgi:hypothetical protein